jgi:hypothetical protein
MHPVHTLSLQGLLDDWNDTDRPLKMLDGIGTPSFLTKSTVFEQCRYQQLLTRDNTLSKKTLTAQSVSANDIPSISGCLLSHASARY